MDVTLLGAVSETRVRDGVEAAHIFALASLNEGISVAIMEAMAMEMPVVVTDVGGNHELITSGRDAILVPPEEPDDGHRDRRPCRRSGHTPSGWPAGFAGAGCHGLPPSPQRRGGGDGLARSLPDAAQVAAPPDL